MAIEKSGMGLNLFWPVYLDNLTLNFRDKENSHVFFLLNFEVMNRMI